MEPYENEHPYDDQTPENPPMDEPAAPQPEQPRPARKPSPYANSPYVTSAPYVNPSYEYRQNDRSYGCYQQPAATRPKSKGVSVGWLIAVVICLAVALIASSVSIILTMQKRMDEQNALLAQSFEEKLNVLREEMRENSHVGSGESVSGTPNTNISGLTPAQVYAQNAESVVAISCTGSDGMMQSTSSGSGFILSEDGYIASNYHVVEGASVIKVITWDGKQYTAKFIGGEESNDIALLKVEAKELPPVTVGSSDALIVGDQVVAIGNPLGELASTLTVGYVSAKDRVITTDGSQINMLQTDAAINPGNSGGPLFNMRGEVVGITTAKYSGTTSSGASIEGIGFAIPVDDVLGMLEDLKVHGYVTGAYLGVTVSDVPTDDAALYGLPMGVLVHDVADGSCASKAGIRAQDIIVDLGGYKIENMNDLTRALRKFKAGDTITVTVYRHSSGGEKLLSVTLDEKPRQNSEPSGLPESTLPDDGGLQDWFDRFFGN